MRSHILSLALAAATARAQSAPQFEVVVAENLPVTYESSNTEVTPPGVLLPRNDTLEAPTLSLPSNALQNQTYIAFMIDQDVPRNGTTFTLLHWFRPDLHRTTNDTTLQVTMIDDTIPNIQGAEYIPPTPPANSGPHRYTFLLYAQPPNFSLPEQFAAISPPASTADRIGFNLTAFALAANLSEPVAANYLRVLNGTEAETSTAETATGAVGVAPSAEPTVLASTTDSEAAASASGAATATETGGSESASGSGTAEASSPVETASGSGATGTIAGSGRDLLLGVALAAVAAGMVMA